MQHKVFIISSLLFIFSLWCCTSNLYAQHHFKDKKDYYYSLFIFQAFQDKIIESSEPVHDITFNSYDEALSIKKFQLRNSEGWFLWSFELVDIITGDLNGDSIDEVIIVLESEGGGGGGNVGWTEYYILNSKDGNLFQRLRANNHNTIINPPKNQCGAYATINSISDQLLHGTLHVCTEQRSGKWNDVWIEKEAHFKLISNNKLELVN